MFKPFVEIRAAVTPTKYNKCFFFENLFTICNSCSLNKNTCNFWNTIFNWRDFSRSVAERVISTCTNSGAESVLLAEKKTEKWLLFRSRAKIMAVTEVFRKLAMWFSSLLEQYIYAYFPENWKKILNFTWIPLTKVLAKINLESLHPRAAHFEPCCQDKNCQEIQVKRSNKKNWKLKLFPSFLVLLPVLKYHFLYYSG